MRLLMDAVMPPHGREFSYRLPSGDEVKISTQESDTAPTEDFPGPVMGVDAWIDGELAGHLAVSYGGDTAIVFDTWVAPAWRRRGLATVMHDHLERLGFKEVAPGGGLSDDGRKFWKKRRPDEPWE